MEKEDIELKLLVNVPIHLDGAPPFILPSFRTVAEVGLSIYNYMLSTLLIDKKSFDKQMDERFTNFDIFYANCYHNQEFKDVAFSGLRLFFMDEPVMQENEEDVFMQFSNGVINRSNFNELQYILKLAHHLKLESEDKPEFVAGNDEAQKMIDRILKGRKKQPPKKEKIDLISMATGLGWKPNGVSIKEVFDLTIYQIYSGFFATNNIDNYHHTISGIYAGTIDGKNIKLPDIHWANKINE